MEIRIKKAKITKDNKISITFEKKNLSGIGTWDEYSLTCADLAKPEFYDTLTALAPHVIDMCELPENYLNRIGVKGVSFSYSGEADVMGATIIAAMELRNSYNLLNLNTPHKTSSGYGENETDEMLLLSDDCIEALEKFCAEAFRYIDGDRAQMTLFGAA